MSRAAEIVTIDPDQVGRLPLGKEVDAVYGDILIWNATIGGFAAVRDANVNTQAVQGAVLHLVRLDLPGRDNDLLVAYYPHGHELDAPGPCRLEIL